MCRGRNSPEAHEGDDDVTQRSAAADQNGPPMLGGGHSGEQGYLCQLPGQVQEEREDRDVGLGSVEEPTQD